MNNRSAAPAIDSPKPAAQATASAGTASPVSTPLARSTDGANLNFGDLARRIAAWTTNLLTAAIVIALGLALGWQIIGWFREAPSPEVPAEPMGATILPPVADEHEFKTSFGLVKVQRQTGTPAEAMAAMRAFCREKPPDAEPRTIGPGETAFVKQLLGEQPLEASQSIALYQPPDQATMIVAVDRSTSRIVAWSFATPIPGGGWSLYHFRPK